MSNFLKFLKDHRSYTFFCGAIALTVILFSIYSRYLNTWKINRSGWDNFLHPLTTVETYALNVGLFVPPVLFLIWGLWVKGWKRIFKNVGLSVGLLASFLIVYSISAMVLSYLLFDVLQWDSSNISRDLLNGLLFLCLLTVWNLFLIRIEGLKLNKRQTTILILSSLIIPVYWLVWEGFLSLFINGSFVKDGFSNGGWVSSFVLYEGLFLLWVKSKQSFSKVLSI